MKKYFLISIVLFSIFYGCTTTKVQYVPVESIRVEYRDNFSRDSIYFRDSIFVRDKGDTVILEKYTYLYKDKLIRDSVFMRDTIQVPFQVEIPYEVNIVTGWQNFQIWLGRILLVFLIVFFGFKLLKRYLV